MKLHTIIPLVVLVIACVFATYATTEQKKAVQPEAVAEQQAPAAPTEIQPEELRTLLAQQAPIYLLDVRQTEEFEQGHLDGANLIPLDALATRLAEVPKDKKVVVYCRSGARSAQATALLKQNGYTDVVTLAGGLNAWETLPPAAPADQTTAPAEGQAAPAEAAPAVDQPAVEAPAQPTVTVPTVETPAAK